MYFLGIDLAGEKNTWIVALKEGRTLSFEILKPVSLESIVSFCEKHWVLGVAIDAPLTFGLKDEKGFRESDQKLRNLLPKEASNWVVSYHGLQAVPIRGKILAEALSPVVGTILETHPRASLYFFLPKEMKELTFRYKPKKGLPKAVQEEALKKIWGYLLKSFDIPTESLENHISDGLVDALVCALTAWLFHRAPENLISLSSKALGTFGRGPFVVIQKLPRKG
ncbi:MAG TPA: DUF429 domain-containing protein [Thermodesulfobacteriaceae bacterium]|nr:DUF429 domain-containing protein [Thermodesulfobacteriaceae bacterium]